MKKIQISEGKLNSIVRNAINEAVAKKTIINRLYKIVAPFTRCLYHDEVWQGVDEMVSALRDAGYNVTVSVDNGGYRNSLGGNCLFVGDDAISYWKEYNLEIPVEDRIIYGRICCHAAGTVEDPFSAYDQTCTFW